MLRWETKSILHLLMQSADTLLICITQQKIPTEKKQLILRSLYYHPKAKLVFFKNHKNVRPEAYETMRCSFHPDQCNV